MKTWSALSIILMVSCAHVPAPASVPATSEGWIHLVPMETDEPACNRSAFEITWLRKKQTERTHKLQMLDCVERAELAESRAHTAAQRADSALWWGQHGPLAVAGVGVVLFVLGVMTGWGITH